MDDAGLTDTSSDHDLSPRCPGEAYYYEWVIDGERGFTECGVATGQGSTSAAFGDSIPRSTHILSGIAVSDPPHPLCGGTEFWFANMDLVTGGSGLIAPDRNYTDQESSVWARTQAAFGVDCYDDLSDNAVPISGSWHVVEGGGWGDVVTVEVRDLLFEPGNGLDVEIPYYFWRGRLTDSPIRYP